MKDRCLFFFDFDDTIYSHITKSVPESAQQAMIELGRQGHILVMASGRGRDAIPLFQTELSYVPDTQILLNGQIIYQYGHAVYENYITLSDINPLFELARKNGFAYGGYYWDGTIVNCVNERVSGVWGDFGQPLPLVCEKLEKEYPIYQAHLYINREENGLFEEVLENYLPNWSHEYLVNLIHKSTGKDKAVNWCIERFGIPRERTYAFGDGFNDVDMIKAVGHGIAMGNGFERLKESAECVTKAAHEDGVCLALQHYGFL